MVWWGTNNKNEVGCNTGSAFTFVAVEDPSDNDLEFPILDNGLEFPILDNDTRIMTLPFDISEDGRATASGNMAVYSLKNIKVDAATGKSSLELTDSYGKSIKAGQTFSNVFIDGQTGYIDPNKVVDPDPTAAADATITVDALLNKIKVVILAV